MKINLKEERKEYICTCERSSNFPTCDGTHEQLNESEGTSYKPLIISSISEDETKVKKRKS